ncbi:ABC transporter permease [Ornithinimicrobium faecis]|uniref:ABC transporter permease n=1 Tax=Ornithinimicrobium faecis TaxID=2934158 RepID=UPI002117C4AF|nr:ABC transporter permease subunit [Ornithinimicrobium sp. HY1745]
MTTAVEAPTKNQVPMRSRLRDGISNWAGILAILAVWEVLGQVLTLKWLPPFSEVLVRLGELFADGTIQPHLIASFRSLLIGFVISLVVGLGVGIAMGLSSRVFAALDIYVNAMLFVPALTFAPILFAAFGLSDTTRIAVVILYTIFIIIINTAAGIRDVDDPLIDMAASFGASPAATVRRVILPSAIPLIMAGIRLGTGRAVKGMINGEMFIALIGLGGLAAKFGDESNFPSVWAMAVFIMIIAVALNTLVNKLEKRTTSWYA